MSRLENHAMLRDAATDVSNLQYALLEKYSLAAIEGVFRDFRGYCFGDGGATFFGYDYLKLYCANAQNTYRRIHKSYCSRPIQT